MRFDHYFGNDFLTLEGGYSDAKGPVIQTGIGRVQILEQKRPWARVNYSSEHFNVLSYYNKRDAPSQLALASGANLVLELRASGPPRCRATRSFAAGKGRLVGGLSYKDENIDTEGTLTLRKVGGDRQAAYAQVDYAFTPKLKAVVAGRYDDSSLHDAELSPKVALVLAPTPNHTFRLTYNEAFQSPNYSEFFLAAPAGAPLNLSPVISAIERGAGLPAGALGRARLRLRADPRLRQRGPRGREDQVVRGGLLGDHRRQALRHRRLLQQPADRLRHRPAAGGQRPTIRSTPPPGVPPALDAGDRQHAAPISTRCSSA